jgi:hypothetical protein
MTDNLNKYLLLSTLITHTLHKNISYQEKINSPEFHTCSNQKKPMKTNLWNKSVGRIAFIRYRYFTGPAYIQSKTVRKEAEILLNTSDKLFNYKYFKTKYCGKNLRL